MAYYAQTNYQEKVGNGPYTLAQIGCFVTAFCNLLEKYGDGNIEPNVLNVFLTEHNVYLPDPLDGTGVKDDLAWGSITAYDPAITVAATGSGSWPNTDDAIVEFRYRENGAEISHFCLVDSVANKSIVDSWDGKVKTPDEYVNTYGAPVAWATYVKNTPNPVPTPRLSNSASSAFNIPAPDYDGESITVQLGWGLSNAAQAAGWPDANEQSRWIAIALLNGSNDWQTFNAELKPGQRIKVGRYEPAINQPTVTHETNGWKTVTVQPGWGLERVAAAAGRPDANLPECWQEITVANGGSAWQSFNARLQPRQQVKVPPQGYHGEGEDTPDKAPDTTFTMDTSTRGMYKSLVATEVYDLSDLSKPDKPLPADAPVTVAGSFTVNGEDYYRPQFAVSENSWYGIPKAVLQAEQLTQTKVKVGLYGRVIETLGFVVGRLQRRNSKKV